MMTVLLMAQVLACANPQTQMDMTACAGLASVRADAALNVQWKRTLTAAHKQDAASAGDPSAARGPSSGDALLASQRAWLQFRDAECRVESDAARGGSMQPMLIADCVRQLTVERTKQLARIAKDG